MEAYPPDYVVHNLPLIVLSGLPTPEQLDPLPPVHDVLPGRAATTLSSEAAALTSPRARQLLQEFRNLEGGNAPWNGRAIARRGNVYPFRMRTAGRDFRFPPQKADAPAASATSPPASPTIAPAWVLHSPISPLTPDSPVFPDGVMTPSWIAKHQHYVPAVFVSFFSFASDPITNSLHDNQLKTDINAAKAQIQKSDYRTRYAVVLLSDKSILESPDIEERLANIRRATGLDTKTSLFFLPPNTSQVELRSFVVSVLSALQPICIDYYRDLTKHSRRKKARGTAPPPTAAPTRGLSHPLTQPGWNVRYDFKLAVFAEFRQEMDAAQRHYAIALDSLFGSDGIFETTASWSPRWDEIRLLADMIALRHIRCQLWNALPTAAVQTWLTYKGRLRDLLDRRGKGSQNYGWEAWESRWAHVMAQLIQKADLPAFKISRPISNADPLVDGVNPTFSPAEKQLSVGERLPPWELLHHPGYWYKLSADHAKRRFILARDIPEEDRAPPEMTPAGKVSNRNQTYDLYLVPEPHLEMPLSNASGGFEHWKDMVSKLEESALIFEARGQVRKVEQLQLEISRTLLHVKEYSSAFKVLRPLWEAMSWRREGWWKIASEVLWALHECSLHVRDPETYVATEWELYSPSYPAKARYRHDLMACLDSFPHEVGSNEKHTISLDTKDFVSCLSSSFTFSEGEGNVGEPLWSQIALTSGARQGSAPITLSTLLFQLKGCLSEIQLSHKAEEGSSTDISALFECTLEETSVGGLKPRWSGTADLTIHPSQTKVYHFPVFLREAGDVEVIASVFEVNGNHFDLVCTHSETDIQERPTWWLRSGSKLKPRKLNRETGNSAKVLPKPPKMEVHLPNMREHYYTDEPVELDIEVWNKEDEETEAVLEVRLLGRSKDSLGFSWIDRDVASSMKEEPPPVNESSDVDLPGHVVGRLASGERIKEKIRFQAPTEPSDYALEVKVLYHLLSDRDIPVSKTLIADLIFNSPFEGNFELNPLVHPDPWPSYFLVEEAETQDNEFGVAFGISQKWHVTAKIASFAEEPLNVKSMALKPKVVHGAATCNVADQSNEVELIVNPHDYNERSFIFDSRKQNLEERRPTSIDAFLDITWQRASSPSNPFVTSSVPIPRMQFITSEPRVLADAIPSSTVYNCIHLDYVLENPTMHFLTFELTMEASEEFGFSGGKLSSLRLLPMSRQTVRYNLFPQSRGVWITPNLRVVDKYFNQVLKVVATAGLRNEKNGVGIWVPEEDVDDDN